MAGTCLAQVPALLERRILAVLSLLSASMKDTRKPIQLTHSLGSGSAKAQLSKHVQQRRFEVLFVKPIF